MKQLDGLACTRRHVSNLACIEGCLQYLGGELPASFLYAGTGWAWILHVDSDCCPSGPHSWLLHEVVPRRAKALGIDMDGVGCYNYTFHEFAKNAAMFIGRAMDLGVPCYVWHWEYSIVKALREGEYVLTWPWGQPPDTEEGGRLPSDRLADIPREEVYSVRLGPKAPDHEIVKSALSFAVESSRSGEGWGGHRNGTIEGYDNWIAGLESGEKVAWDGVGYHASLWAECRGFATDFLEAASGLTDKELNGLFKSAAKDYAAVTDCLKEVAALFPFPNVPPDEDRAARRAQLEEYVEDQGRRNEAAKHLRKAKEAEQSGVEWLKQIVNRM